MCGKERVANGPVSKNDRNTIGIRNVMAETAVKLTLAASISGMAIYSLYFAGEKSKSKSLSSRFTKTLKQQFSEKNRWSTGKLIANTGLFFGGCCAIKYYGDSFSVA